MTELEELQKKYNGKAVRNKRYKDVKNPLYFIVKNVYKQHVFSIEKTKRSDGQGFYQEEGWLLNAFELYDIRKERIKEIKNLKL